MVIMLAANASELECTLNHTWGNICICVCARVYIYIYIYIHTYTYIHIYIYIYIYIGFHGVKEVVVIMLAVNASELELYLSHPWGGKYAYTHMYMNM